MDIGATLFAWILLGSIGAAHFVYGKRQQQIVPMLAGVALCVYPYFVSHPVVMIVIGAVLVAVPWIVRF
jgi:hypothetical protein